MSSDWQRITLQDLIDSYKSQENLYNTKHPLYYNKQARSKGMDEVLNAVRKTRPTTTLEEISKKIQTLRTQFSQEFAKIEKSYALGDESLIYMPRVWWFPKMVLFCAFITLL
jgi:hypothetical protein